MKLNHENHESILQPKLQPKSEFSQHIITPNISQPLLLLQNRQIVKHMIMVMDWTILCIYTPSTVNQHKKHEQHNSQNKLSEMIYSYDKKFRQDRRNVSAIAIRTFQKENKTKKFDFVKKNHYNKNNQDQYKEKDGQNSSKERGKDSQTVLEQIKMIHKQIRVQNMIEWKIQQDNKQSQMQTDGINEKTFQQSFGNNSSTNTQRSNFNINSQKIQTKIKNLTKKSYFLILSNTRIQLYTIQRQKQLQIMNKSQQPIPSTITLTKIYEINYLIPYNIIWLKNQNHQKQKKFLSQRRYNKQSQQKYKIAIVGIDRKVNFWTGQYQIQRQKRNIYLFQNFIITDQIKSCKKDKQTKYKVLQKGQISKNQNKNTLRKVRSVDNLFNFNSEKKNDNEKRSNFRQQKNNKYVNNLSKSHYVPQNSTNMVNTFQQGYYHEDNIIQTSSSSSKNQKYENQPTNSFQSSSTSSKESSKRSTYSKKQKKPISQLIPKHLLFDDKMQIIPQILQSHTRQQKTGQSNKLKFLKSFGKQSQKHKDHLFPPLILINHFYYSTPSILSNFDNKKQLPKDQKQKLSSKYHPILQNLQKNKHQLCFLISYLNNLILINYDKQQMISKIQLDKNTLVTKSISVYNIFGIYSCVIETKKYFQEIVFNKNNKSKSQTQLKTKIKLIKATIDVINNKKLGLGLQPIRFVEDEKMKINCQKNLGENNFQLFCLSQNIQKLQQRFSIRAMNQQSSQDMEWDRINQKMTSTQRQQFQDYFQSTLKKSRQPIFQNQQKATIQALGICQQIFNSTILLPDLKYCILIFSNQTLHLLNHITGKQHTLYTHKNSTKNSQFFSSANNQLKINKLCNKQQIQVKFDTSANQIYFEIHFSIVQINRIKTTCEVEDIKDLQNKKKERQNNYVHSLAEIKAVKKMIFQ